MIDFYSLLELSQLKAIYAALEPSLESIYRMKCRDYSIKYNTPLHVVINDLDPMFVLQHLYEDQYHPSIVEEELEELLDKLYIIKDPTYSRMSKEDTEELVDNVLNREIARAAKKKAPTQQSIQSEVVESVVDKTLKAIEKPKSGSLNFSSLEKSDAKLELNKNSFED